MFFELTQLLENEIIHAMENQNETMFLDSKQKKLVSGLEDCENEQDIFTLPQWNSTDGYNLLESFVETFKGSKAVFELKEVLNEGRGVFKNFKLVLKKYPEIERRFNCYKNKILKNRLYEWYNELREGWGLENLNPDFDEYDDLVLEDFIFKNYDEKSDSKIVALFLKNFTEELKSRFGDEIGFSLANKLNLGGAEKIQENLISQKIEGFVCRSLSDEFAGCILYSSNYSKTQKSVFITHIFVNQNYRGLGIATELIKKVMAHLKKCGIQFLMISNSIVPEMLKSTLVENGFVKNDFVFLVELK